MEGAMWPVDLWLMFLCVLLVALITRAIWLRDRLGFPPDWNADEQHYAQIATFAFVAAALASAAVATYAASIVPWVNDLPSLTSHPPQLVRGRAPAPISTASYLFGIPVTLGVVAGMLVDPAANRRLSFRGPRDIVLRLCPLLAIGFAAYSIWRSIDALSAAW
jgi:hypothetical protein